MKNKKYTYIINFKGKDHYKKNMMNKKNLGINCEICNCQLWLKHPIYYNLEQAQTFYNWEKMKTCKNCFLGLCGEYPFVDLFQTNKISPKKYSWFVMLGLIGEKFYTIKGYQQQNIKKEIQNWYKKDDY